ncbi:MAG: hypothetical protein A3J73_03220 [Planctomycetes bacterium RIFCSPHIGHO2_02_FULL_38_41]|nr:MAG: hypothetical protein A3J73_03220 [Planctomycetes bacterium RIFCSPHIGHO2_02_FULL_38_41]OHC05102.1 MAG: hypothetical protein A2Z57_06160 [Planctomycetes bacterium RIFCSPHIGHO2_12_39_6]
MSIERIRDHIIKNAQKEAEQVINTAKEHLHKKVNEAKLSIEKEYETMLLDEEKRLKEDMQNALITLGSNYKMSLLEIKNNIIDNVMQDAINHIQSLSDNEYLVLIRSWIGNIADGTGGELLVDARDLKRMTGAFIDGINKERKEKIVLGVRLLDIKGGFILKTQYYEIDYTLDSIIKNLRTALTPELNKILQLSDIEL